MKGNVTSQVHGTEPGALYTHTKRSLTLWCGGSDDPELTTGTCRFRHLTAHHEAAVVISAKQKPRLASRKEKSYMPQSSRLGSKTLEACAPLRLPGRA